MSDTEKLLHDISAADGTKFRTEGRKRFLHMMFTTAMEGGIGYWSVAENYHWQHKNVNPSASWDSSPHQDDINGFYAVIEPNEGEWGVGVAYIAETGGFELMTEECQQQPLRIDIGIMERGVNLLVDKVIEAAKSEDSDVGFSRKYLRQFVIQWLTDTEEGDSDADVADFVVQLGLFGEVVYA